MNIIFHFSNKISLKNYIFKNNFIFIKYQSKLILLYIFLIFNLSESNINFFYICLFE
jgi:hypothetical protein